MGAGVAGPKLSSAIGGGGMGAGVAGPKLNSAIGGGGMAQVRKRK